MKHLKFYGKNCSMFGEYAFTNTEIDNGASLLPIQCIINAHEYGKMMVIGQYTRASLNNECWMIGVCKVNEHDSFPEWEITFKESSKKSNTMELNIVVPDDNVKLIWYNDGDYVFHYQKHKKLEELIEQGYIQSSYNEGTEEQLDYFLHRNNCNVGDAAYCYHHVDGTTEALEIVRSIRRSDDTFMYDELNKNEDVLLDGERAYYADTSAEFVADDCYLVWFRRKQEDLICIYV